MKLNKDTSTSIPKVTPKTPAPKVLVAQSDYVSALKAIENVMVTERNKFAEEATQVADSSKEDRPPKDSPIKHIVVEEDVCGKKTESTDGENATAAATTETERTANNEFNTKQIFLSKVHESLKDLLAQIVEPIQDEEYHQRSRNYFLQERIEEENHEEQLYIAQQKAQRRAQRDAQHLAQQQYAMDCNTDYDPCELLDRDAIHRARELRQQVRTLSSTVLQQQDAMLARAIRLAQRQVRLWTDDILNQPRQKLDNSFSNEKDHIDSTRRLQLQQMRVSLHTLLTSLSRTVEGDIPANLRDMQDTIRAIEAQLTRKQMPLSQLSQTDQAILSRTNEGGTISSQQFFEGMNEGGVESNNDKNQSFMMDGVSVIVEEENNDPFHDMSNPYVFLADFLGRY